jgi:hypothetical protein
MLKNSILFLVVLLVFFFIAEGIVRLVLPPPQEVIVKPNTQKDIGNPNKLKERRCKSCDETDILDKTARGRRYSPNTHYTIQHGPQFDNHRVDVITNSLGHRGPELGAKQDKRVLFLGDSITASDYLDEEKTFVRVVESIARVKNKSWETINAGVGAIGIQEEFGILMDTGLQTNPDVVVLGFYLNDFERSPAVHLVHLPSPLDQSYFLRHLITALTFVLEDFKYGNKVVTAFDKNVMEIKQKNMRSEFLENHDIQEGDYKVKAEAFNKIVLERIFDWGGSWAPSSWDLMEPVIKEFKKQAGLHKFDFKIVVFPVSYQVYADNMYDYPQRRIMNIAAENDIALLDLLPVLRLSAKKMDEREMYYDHCHFTEPGSRLVANEIFKFLM